LNRVFVPDEAWREDGRLRLEGPAAHYLLTVLRLRAGETFAAATENRGNDRICRIEEAERRALTAVVIGERAAAPEPPVAVRLFCGWPKGDKLDLIIQKGTELGVAAFTPVLTERSVPRPPADRLAPRLARWRAIAREASEQSGRAVIPSIEGPATLAEVARALAADAPPVRAFLLWEKETSRGLMEAIGVVSGGDAPAPLTPLAPPAVSLITGPEGGLTAGEVEELIAAGAQPVTLGPRILRAETAALAAASLTLAVLGDLGRGRGGPW
jgi:16S rRNA (uracil1498-N3)-methyltransferase